MENEQNKWKMNYSFENEQKQFFMNDYKNEMVCSQMMNKQNKLH